MIFSHSVPAQSITALACSLLNKFEVKPQHATLSVADCLLEGAPRNIVLLLLDGLGLAILQRHLPPQSFLQRHVVGTLSSVFPPTTAAAATALESGLFPAQNGWLGWTVFWPPSGENVALYPNTNERGQPAAPHHIGRTYLGFSSLVQQVQAHGTPAYALPEKGDIRVTDLPSLCTSLRDITSQPGPHFIYGYSNQPDALLHKEGCGSPMVTHWLQAADRLLATLTSNCPDTLFLLTSDHGFTDVDGLCLEDFPALASTLVRLPSIEPRALNLFVNPTLDKNFHAQFDAATQGTYRLYTRQQALTEQLFGPGPVHPQLPNMLGDYIAVAQTPLTLFPNRKYLESMIAGHGGGMAEEMTVPLIAWRTD